MSAERSWGLMKIDSALLKMDLTIELMRHDAVVGPETRKKLEVIQGLVLELEEHGVEA